MNRSTPICDELIELGNSSRDFVIVIVIAIVIVNKPICNLIESYSCVRPTHLLYLPFILFVGLLVQRLHRKIAFKNATIML